MRAYLQILLLIVSGTVLPGAAAAQAGSAERMPRPSGAELRLASYPTAGVDATVRVFLPGGEGPHPVLILFHGFPGTELNFDLAHAAMRAGWAVVMPHYRGSWGVGGDYTFEHTVEDGNAVLAWVEEGRTAERFHLDRRRIIVVGHSAGGFVALEVAASHPEVVAVAGIAAFDFGAYVDDALDRPGSREAALQAAIEATGEAWASSAEVLHGPTGESLAEEVFSHGAAWRLAGTAAALRSRPVLLVAARDDDIAVPAVHFSPLVRALKEDGATRLTAETLAGGHGFEDSREALVHVVSQWLATLGAGH